MCGWEGWEWYCSLHQRHAMFWMNPTMKLRPKGWALRSWAQAHGPLPGLLAGQRSSMVLPLHHRKSPLDWCECNADYWMGPWHT